VKVWADYDRLDAADLNTNFSRVGTRIGTIGYGVLTIGNASLNQTPLKLASVAAGDASLAAIATSEIVVPYAGLWLVTAAVRGTGVPVGQLYRGNLRRNGVDDLRLFWSSNGSGAGALSANSVAAVIPLAAADRLTLFATGASGYTGSQVDGFGIFQLVPSAP
jgi:hypothetical protein